LEAWLVGLAILFLLSLQVGAVSPVVLTNGLFFLCGTSGLWAVLRCRLPHGRWPRQFAWEVAMGLAVSLVMAAGITLPAMALGWEAAWHESSLASGDAFMLLLLLGIGPGYVVSRGGVRFWLAWDRLRRRRMLWAITHAHLTVVVLLILLVVGGGLLFSALSGGLAEPQPADLAASLTERLLQTMFPAIVLMFLLTAAALAALLPPSAIFSFLVARRTTRRIEDLAEAAEALSQGRYDTRVEPSGEDEVARLQSGFNTMAGELARTLGDLEAERDKVAALLQSRRELVAGVSHELRTPVTTVRATLESALDGQGEDLPAELRHDLEVVANEVLRLQRLIDDLFALSQAEAGGLHIDLRPVDAGPVVRRMVDALAPLAWASGRVEVVAELPAGLPPALADEARLEQILANLLRNAIRHTPPGGIVIAAGRAEPGAVLLEVRDTGEGIAQEDLPHIWERFYRGPQAPGRQRPGAGLGLALVKELAEAMGGSAGVESTVGQGSCFTVRLPIEQVPPPEQPDQKSAITRARELREKTAGREIDGGEIDTAKRTGRP
jgi:signal transduction histidine kinase